MANTENRLRAYLKRVASTALGRRPAGRELTVFPKDIFLVSYLRSGSTWMRFLFGNLVHPQEPITFANVGRLVPEISSAPDRVLRKMPVRILKSHECFDPRYPRVVYVVRDPRDVAVSFYYYNLKVRVLPDGYPLDEFVHRFIAAKVVSYADRLGCWQDHVLSWFRLRHGKPGFHFIRYEDLLSNPESELTKAAAVLGISTTPDNIKQAIDRSSAGNMRSLERKQWKKWGTTKNSRQDILFVREAKSGGWQTQLSNTAVRAIESAWGPTMQELGYELAAVSHSATPVSSRI